MSKYLKQIFKKTPPSHGMAFIPMHFKTPLYLQLSWQQKEFWDGQNQSLSHCHKMALGAKICEHLIFFSVGKLLDIL